MSVSPGLAFSFGTKGDRSTVTLGLAPLAGPVRRGLRAAQRLGARLYDVQGLHAFKAKLRPDGWAPIYLVYPPGGHGLVAIHDALAAFARGGLLRFGLSTLLRGPAVVFEVLGWLLIPWTALLALAPAARWFPSPAVKWPRQGEARDHARAPTITD
ncbi:hypothetical protein WMF38_05870 [Sorangium sp. So ce118]